MKEKEELRKKFYKWYENVELPDGNWHDATFNFFYSEIEQRDKEIMKLGDMVTSIGKVLLKPNEKEVLEAKISHLEAIILAADEVIEKAKHSGYFNNPHNSFWVYLEKYNEEKSTRIIKR